MAKRFTDTGLYQKSWFRKLPPRIKCLWEWLRNSCDHAGVIEFDPELASFQIGEAVNNESLEYFGSRIENLGGGKIWLVDFVHFQYGELKENYNPHKPVIKSLLKNNLTPRLAQGLPKASQSLMDKDKDKDQYKDLDQDKEKEGETLSFDQGKRFSIERVTDLYNKKIAGQGQAKAVPHFTSPNSIQSFLTITGIEQFSTIDGWNLYFDKVLESDFLLGRTVGTKLIATVPWLLKIENAEKVFSGQYQNAEKELSRQEIYEKEMAEAIAREKAQGIA